MICQVCFVVFASLTPQNKAHSRHPIKKSTIEIERMKNKIQRNAVEKKGGSAWNATAYNERFGATAAVTPQKRQCVIESLYPAGSVVEAAASPSRRHVVCNRGSQRPVNRSQSCKF